MNQDEFCPTLGDLRFKYRNVEIMIVGILDFLDRRGIRPSERLFYSFNTDFTKEEYLEIIYKIRTEILVYLTSNGQSVINEKFEEANEMLYLLKTCAYEVINY
jgi:hypothetical protein